MWKSFEEFHTSVMADREVIESIVHRSVDKYRLDAASHTVRLPDLLLRECEQEIQRVNVVILYKCLLVIGVTFVSVMIFLIYCCISMNGSVKTPILITEH